MTKPKLTIAGQRYELGKGWINCPDHRAIMWSVGYSAEGRWVNITRLSTKWKADSQLQAELMRQSPMPRAYKLGKRLPAKTEV